MACAPDLGKVLHHFKAPKRKIHRVFVHCSAASRRNIDAKEIDQWHRKRGWACIGYNFFVTSSGRVEIGRDIERTPAAQRGHNSGTIAICLNGLELNDFSAVQFDSLRKLCQEIHDQIPGVTFHGHREVAAKECPVFDYRRVLGLDKRGRLIGAAKAERQAAREEVVKEAKPLAAAGAAVGIGGAIGIQQDILWVWVIGMIIGLVIMISVIRKDKI